MKKVLQILFRPYINAFELIGRTINNTEKKEREAAKRLRMQRIFESGGYESIAKEIRANRLRQMGVPKCDCKLKLPSIYEFIEMQKPTPPNTRKYS